MTRLLPVILALLLLLSGCGGEQPTEESAGQPTGQEKAEAAKENTYQQITQDEAKRMMDEQDVVILDVREQSEYDGGHIAGAVLLPVDSVDEESAAAAIPEKDSVVLVYCRSGNRSKTASEALAELGYTQVYEFGGVITWSHGLVR